MTTPRSPRSSRLAQSAISVVAIWTALSGVVTAITISTGRTLFATGGADGRLPLTALPSVNQAELREGSTGTLAEADLGLRLISAAPSVINAITVILAAFFLIVILDRVATGHSFETPVLRLWKYLSVTLLVGGVVQSVLGITANLYLTINVYGTGIDGQAAFLGGDYDALSFNVFDLPITLLLGGLISLALTLAFRAGSRLESEVDGVV